MKIPIYKIDAFAENTFSGNPAAVCIMDKWIEDELMQKIAGENNLAETAFIVKNNNQFEIRWFTPTTEVDLCGHATLASAFVLFNHYNVSCNPIVFNSHRSGILKVYKEENDLLVLDFPVDDIQKCTLPKDLQNGFNITPSECYKGKTDYMLVYNSQDEIESLNPDLTKISKVKARGVIVTAPGNKVDFVSRFFAPQSGINEDPVTGSAHTSLTPYWSKRLNKETLVAMQLSQRTGNLKCQMNGDRVLIGGNAVLFLKGEIYLND